ncbi:MAG: PspC domain-containing protein [Bacteroidales bacterium]|jgi:phage shock protein PspC (stress-responsive transcriptional regulator)|nr:PspC domain-containing protein [Bacteroidales bacterium]
MYKALARSRSDKMIGGVAGGMAEYFQMDSALVRFLFVVITFLFGTGIWIYIVLWIILPEQSLNDYYSRFKNTPPPDMENENVNPKPERDPYKEFQNQKRKKKENGGFFAGIILITLGLLFLLDQFLPSINFGDLWPVLLIVIGGLLLRNYFNSNKQNDNQQNGNLNL